jgi:hypothetical protein
MRILPLIVVCLFMGAGYGHAQMEPGLKGLTEVELVIEKLSADSQACGITEQSIRDAFTFPVSSTALKISKPSITNHPVFYIKVITIREDAGRCTSAIQFRVFEFRLIKPDFSDLSRSAAVEYWHDNWLGFSGQSQHNKMIRDDVEAATKRFLTKWNLDNKPQ